MSYHAVRLQPDEDLRPALARLLRHHRWTAAAVVTGVGSLLRTRLRLAGADRVYDCEGPFEIVSLVGTLGVGGEHLHMAVADADGAVVGGHVLAGNPIATTAEVVVASLPDVRFVRRPDLRTGYRELEILLRRR